MGRLQKKKTENQKIKQKIRQKDKQDLPSDGNTEIADGSKLEAVKRPAPQTKTFGTKKTASSVKEPGRMERIQDFLREVRAELNKVVWPTKNQTISSTVVVIVLVIIVSSFLGLFDLGLKGLIRMVLH